MNIIVTGATKGIGRAIVKLFAEEGFNLAFCARTKTDVDAFKEDLLKKYPKLDIIAEAIDMSKKDQVEHFARSIQSKWEQVDILVNNTGVYLQGEVLTEEDGLLEQLIETNLYSAYYMTRAILPSMLPFNKGHIFNMCSIASQIAYPNSGSYSISKFALLGFTKALREELKNKGIKVTALLPGATWSNSWSWANFPEDRLMQAKDIAIAIKSAWEMSASSVVEEILIRPQLGDL